MMPLKPGLLALAITASMLTGCFDKQTASDIFENTWVKVTAYEVPQGDLIESPVLNLTGRTGSSDQEVRSNIPGTIKRAGVAEGQVVKKGQLLFEMDDTALKANVVASQQRYLAARQLYRKVAKAGGEVKSVVAAGGPGQILIDQANTSIQAAHSEYVAALASRNGDLAALQHSKILAQVSGVVGHLVGTAGDQVTPDKLLMVITPPKSQWVEMEMPEGDYQAVQGDKAKAPSITLTFVDGSTAMAQMQAPLQVEDGHVLARAVLKKPSASFIPGDDVQVEIHGQPLGGLVKVPGEAMKTNADGYYVFVVGKYDDRVDIRQVEVVKWTGSDRFVRSGLKPGDRVVTSNFTRLRPGARTKVVDAENP